MTVILRNGDTVHSYNLSKSINYYLAYSTDLSRNIYFDIILA